MPDLVAEMTEQRAIGLAHLIAAALAFCVVGFGEIDGDDAIGMAGHDGEPEGATSARNSKRQTGGILRLRLERQPKLKQRVEQPVLRDFERPPFVEIFRQ